MVQPGDRDPLTEPVRERVARACAGSTSTGPLQVRALVALAALVEGALPGDVRVLHRLVAEHGPEAVAHRVESIDEYAGTGDRTVASAAVLVLTDTDRVVRTLLDDGESQEAAETAAAALEQVAWHLVVAGLDSRPGTRVGPFAERHELGTRSDFDVGRWRPLLAPLVEHPWSRYVDRLEAAAAAADDPWIARLVGGCVEALRQRTADRERRAVAKAIRDAVVVAGVTQKEFAALVGTSQSRFSTYINGQVVPSAAMLLRIRQMSHYLRTGVVRPAS